MDACRVPGSLRTRETPVVRSTSRPPEVPVDPRLAGSEVEVVTSGTVSYRKVVVVICLKTRIV